MSNADANSNVAQLQNGLRNWYSNGLNNVEKEAAAKLWVDNEHTIVDKSDITLPGDHLVSAAYKEVIEMNANNLQKIR